MENDSIKKNPIYRFFNVIIFLIYFAVILAAIFVGLIVYQGRKTVSASLACKDGTRWNPMSSQDIRYNDEAMCGVCTKRNPDNSYKDCEFGSIDYSSFKLTETKESLNWSMFIYPGLVLLFGFGIGDFIKIASVYIFSGRIAMEKSLLLRIFILLFAKDKT